MGTNYYRIPQADEMEKRKSALVLEVTNLDLSPSNIECEFGKAVDDQWGRENPWQTFTNGINVHLGKRSGGWKFCWNFHDNKYYSNKDELIKFIRSGRVVDEYGEEWNVEDFIVMALEWGQPDGWVHNAEYEREVAKNGGQVWGPKYYDLIIDGLRVSTSTEFS
jgi:hypothetical protein